MKFTKLFMILAVMYFPFSSFAGEKMPLRELVQRTDYWSNLDKIEHLKAIQSSIYSNKEFMKLIHQSISSDDLLLFERVLYGFKYRKNISEVHCSFMQRLLENSLMSPTQGFKLPADFISKGIPEKSILNKRITTDIVASRTLDCLVSHPSPNAEKLALQALNFPDATRAIKLGRASARGNGSPTLLSFFSY